MNNNKHDDTRTKREEQHEENDAMHPDQMSSPLSSFDAEAEIATNTTTMLDAETLRAQKDRKLLSLLRSKEERAVRKHWEWALERADVTTRGIGEQKFRQCH